jgi:hypothetical protein
MCRKCHDSLSLRKGRIGKEGLILFVVVIVVEGLDHLIQSTSPWGSCAIVLSFFIRNVTVTETTSSDGTTFRACDFHGAAKLTVAPDATGAVRVLSFQQGCMQGCRGIRAGDWRSNGASRTNRNSSSCHYRSSISQRFQLAPTIGRHPGNARIRRVRSARAIARSRRLGGLGGGAGSSVGIMGVPGATRL